MIIGYVSHWLPQKFKDNLESKYATSPIYVKGIVATLVSVLCYQSIFVRFSAVYIFSVLNKV